MQYRGGFGMGFLWDPKSHIPNPGIFWDFWVWDFFPVEIPKSQNYPKLFPVKDSNFLDFLGFVSQTFWENSMGLGFFFVGWEIPQKIHLWFGLNFLWVRNPNFKLVVFIGVWKLRIFEDLRTALEAEFGNLEREKKPSFTPLLVRFPHLDSNFLNLTRKI